MKFGYRIDGGHDIHVVEAPDLEEAERIESERLAQMGLTEKVQWEPVRTYGFTVYGMNAPGWEDVKGTTETLDLEGAKLAPLGVIINRMEREGRFHIVLERVAELDDGLHTSGLERFRFDVFWDDSGSLMEVSACQA